MAGNRGIYNAAIKRAQEHTRKQEWSAALREYQRAATEFPDDVAARMGIAAAYAGLKRWQDALGLYQELQRAHPEDLVILERLAESHVQVKDLPKARELYLRLSDQYVVHRKMAQAIATLERLGELFPADEELLNRLGRLYQDAGDRNAAIRVQLERARLLFRDGRLQEAMALCEEVLKGSPDNRQAKELLFRLRREITARKGRGEAVEEVGPTTVVSTFQLEEWAREAAERQEQGDTESAIRLYERALQGGLRRADVSYSLGLLYKETGRLAEAIEHFKAASSDDEFALSCHYAMGECYRDLGQLELAAQELERALHLVDLQALGRDAVDDLIQMYEATAAVHERLGDLARAASLYTTLAGFLQSKRWKQGRTDEFRKRAQELTEKSMFAKLRQLGTGILPAIEEHVRGEPARERPGEVAAPVSAIPSLTGDALRPITDFLRPQPVEGFPTGAEAGAAVALKPLEEALAIVPPVPVQLPVRELDTTGLEEPVRELVEASRIYLEKGLFNAAIDACCEVIERAPDYLPIHLRLAEIYERQDRPDMALGKYQALAETYLAREEKERAVEVYQALLALSPDVVATRSRLADLLVELGRPREAAHQLLQMAQTYFRMGQTGRAMETFREVRALAPEDKDVFLEYGLFLLKMDKPEAAIGELRRALQLDARDPLALARVNVTLALLQEEEAFQESLTTVLKRAEEDAEAARTMEKEYRDILLLQESPLLYYALGMLQRQTGQVVEAQETMQRALRAFGPTPSHSLQLSLCRALAEGYLLQDRPDEAVQVLQQGLAWSEVLASAAEAAGPAELPTPLSFYHWIAEAYIKGGRPEQAIAALNQAKSRYPHDRETGTKLADLYFRQGNLRQALAELTELVAYYEQTGQIDRALEILQHMARLAPNNLAVHNRLGHLYIRRGYIDRGLEELDTFSELAHKRGKIEESVRALQEMAEIYWTMGRHDRAYQVYDRIVRLAPDDVSARQQLVNLHILAGRLADALEEQRNIARIALRRKDTETSVAALHQVLALDPQDRWAMRQLADLLASVGEHGQALRLYRRLVRLEPDNAELAVRIQEEERLTEAQAETSG